MDKLAHGEGIWKAISDKVEQDHLRTILVMNRENFRLLCFYDHLHKMGPKHKVESVEEGWTTFHDWRVLVRDDVSYIARIKY